MNWYRCSFRMPAAATDALEESLLTAGHDCLATERQPGESVAQFSIFARSVAELPSPDRLREWIAAAGGDPARIEIVTEPVEQRDDEWNEGFRSHFRSRAITDLVTVIPPWEPRPPEAAPGRAAPGAGTALRLVIEPARAFGTGDHQTTCLCLECLGELARELGGGARCLDVGSGTGILGIAAWLWGAGEVEGYDVDSASISNAYLNADLNGLAGRVRFRWGEPAAMEIAGGRWDLILCNLFLGPILRYLPRFDAALAGGGHAIFSGFLTAQARTIRDAAAARGWELRRESERDGWMLQLWRKPEAAGCPQSRTGCR